MVTCILMVIINNIHFRTSITLYDFQSRKFLVEKKPYPIPYFSILFLNTTVYYQDLSLFVKMKYFVFDIYGRKFKPKPLCRMQTWKIK